MPKKKMLILGSLPDYENPKKIGGVTVSLEMTVNYLNHINYSFDILNNYKYTSNKFIVPFINPFLLLFHVYKYEVILVNVSRNTFLYYAPFVFVISRLFGKKNVLKLNGGRSN